MDFKDKLLELRMAKGWSQKKLADEIGVSQVAITNWEHRGQVPSLKYAQMICAALGVSITIFDGCDFPEKETPKKKPKLGRPKKS
jgi:transcriptional regulator with XRE-family HTH domain